MLKKMSLCILGLSAFVQRTFFCNISYSYRRKLSHLDLLYYSRAKAKKGFPKAKLKQYDEAIHPQTQIILAAMKI